jgi:hypothetical protein
MRGPKPNKSLYIHYFKNDLELIIVYFILFCILGFNVIKIVTVNKRPRSFYYIVLYKIYVDMPEDVLGTGRNMQHTCRGTI